LHVHHKTYERRGEERTSDLVAICLDCHGKEHPQHEFKTQQEREVLRAKNLGKSQKRKPWAIETMLAEKELKKAARFNRLPMGSRRTR